MSTCKNCAQSVTGKYCSNCGQKTSIGRLSIHEVWHDGIHAFTHADKGIVRLVKDLFLRPGQLYRAYFEGKRKTYFSPVLFFLITMGLSIFLYEKLLAWDYHITGRQNTLEQSTYAYQKLRYLFFIPLISLITFLFFRRRFNLAECLAFWFYCCGFVALLEVIAFIPRFVFVQQRHNIAYWTDWLVWLIVLVHLFIVFFSKTWRSALACISVGILFYWLLAYIFTLMAYAKGFSVNLNPIDLMLDVFR
jgi:Protein of unknown function (DUF3667)